MVSGGTSNVAATSLTSIPCSAVIEISAAVPPAGWPGLEPTARRSGDSAFTRRPPWPTAGTRGRRRRRRRGNSLGRRSVVPCRWLFSEGFPAAPGAPRLRAHRVLRSPRSGWRRSWRWDHVVDDVAPSRAPPRAAPGRLLISRRRRRLRDGGQDDSGLRFARCPWGEAC